MNFLSPHPFSRSTGHKLIGWLTLYKAMDGMPPTQDFYGDLANSHFLIVGVFDNSLDPPLS